MTVHARGYRPYSGSFGGPPAWWVILQANVAAVKATKAMRVLSLLLLIIASCVSILLYVQIGLGERVFGRSGSSAGSPLSALWDNRKALLTGLQIFYTAATTVVSLLAILTGAGLVADDLRARALTLLMVRPVRPFDYALGKALVLPWLLVTRAALPGLAMWVLAGAWQQPGETQAFWEATSAVPGLIGTYLLLCAGSYSGLTLLLSAGTSRRGVASALAAAVIFGGLVVRGIGWRMAGDEGHLLRGMSLMDNVQEPIMRASVEMLTGRFAAARLERLPDPTWAAALAAGLFVLGFLRVWQRARSVEVSE